MKKGVIVFLALLCSAAGHTQNNFLLLRHDTAILKAEECEWIIKSLSKNDPALTPHLGKTTPLVILQAVEKGKCKAYDIETNEVIPAGKIFEWRMPADSVPRYDDAGNMTGIAAVTKQVNSDMLPQIRVFQDWYLDIASGKIITQVKWIDLMQEIKTYDGTLIGLRPYCRIFY